MGRHRTADPFQSSLLFDADVGESPREAEATGVRRASLIVDVPPSGNPRGDEAYRVTTIGLPLFLKDSWVMSEPPG